MARGGRGRREPEVPSDTRERQHQDKLGEWGFSGFAIPRGGGDAPSALAGMRDSDQTALAWNPCRLLPEGSPDPGCQASLSHDGGGWEEGSVSPPQPCEGWGEVCQAWGRTWTLRGDLGPGRRWRGRTPRREALFHFPALLRFLRSVSLTSLNFTALGLWPPAPPRGGSGCGVGEPTRPRGDSTRRGAGQAQGAGLCGAASLRLPPARTLVPRGLLGGGGGSGLSGPRGGVCL